MSSYVVKTYNIYTFFINKKKREKNEEFKIQNVCSK